jgi:hypothetical protein
LPLAESGVKVNPDVAGIAHWGIGLPISTVMMRLSYLTYVLFIF